MEVVLLLSLSILVVSAEGNWRRTSLFKRQVVQEFRIPDSDCSSFGGTCQNGSGACNGSYVPGTCGAENRCCSPKIIPQDTKECKNIPIMSRDTWGARPPIKTSNLRLPVSMFFIHHTDTSSCNDLTTCSSLMRIIQKFHMQTRGWNDIGYSFLIGGDGKVYEGRGWKRVGSHTLHYNSRSLALSFIGNFTTQMPTPAALSAAHRLLACGTQHSYLTPKYSLYGHRDVRATTCPGDALYNAVRKWDHYNTTTDLDGPCLKAGGHCWPNYLPCTGHYRTGLCNGYSRRQCCIPKPHVSLPKSIGKYDCFGDVMLLRPTGRKTGGVPASQKSVNAHITLANRFHECFNRVGAELCIHPAVIAGVASRESNFGASLTPDGWGDHHKAYGIMQCDVGACPVCHDGLKCTTYKFDSCAHIRMMTMDVLIPYINQVKAKFPNWMAQQQLQGGVAAYNFGVGNVRSWANLDVGTTGGDYSNDVIARAQFLISSYKW